MQQDTCCIVQNQKHMHAALDCFLTANAVQRRHSLHGPLVAESLYKFGQEYLLMCQQLSPYIK